MQEAHLNILTAQLTQSQSIEIEIENKVFEEPTNHIGSITQNTDEVNEYETAIINNNCIESSNELKSKKSKDFEVEFCVISIKNHFCFQIID